MENPACLLRRAERSRRQKNMPAPPAEMERMPEKPPAAPKHTSSHASYTALMRSHDRVATRHIVPRGGA